MDDVTDPVENNPFVDDDDWIPVRRHDYGIVKGDLVCVLSPRNSLRSKGSFIFRNQAAEFIGRFNHVGIDIGGFNYERFRIRQGSEFKVTRVGKGNRVFRVQFTTDLWPKVRRSAEAMFAIQDNVLIGTLPDGWAKPDPVAITEPPFRPASTLSQAKTAAGALVLKAADTIKAKAPQRSQQFVPLGGEPPPGRSALDQKAARK